MVHSAVTAKENIPYLFIDRCGFWLQRGRSGYIPCWIQARFVLELVVTRCGDELRGVLTHQASMLTLGLDLYHGKLWWGLRCRWRCTIPGPCHCQAKRKGCQGEEK